MDEYRVILNNAGKPIDFTFDGGPLYKGENLTDLYAAIGRFSLAWSQTEQHIEAMLMQINNRAHSERLFNENHPYGFRKKIKALRRWFNQHPALSELSDHFKLISEKLNELAQHRNNILHGSLVSWDHGSKIAKFRTLKFEGDEEFSIKAHTYPIDTIHTLCNLIALTNRYLSRVSHDIFQKKMLAQLRKP